MISRNRTGAACGGRRAWPTTAGLCSLVLLALLPASAPAAAAQGWESTEWDVRCTAETAESLAAGDCDDDAVTGSAAATRSFLQEASEWLKGIGFRGPELPTNQDGGHEYVAWIADDKVGDDYGNYDGENLYVESTSFFAMGEDEDALNLDTPNTGTVIHELFHAIQASYLPDRDLFNESGEWIWEGTAEAVMLSWLRDSRPNSHASGRARYYDHSLHEPNDELDAYDTYHFWLWLGKHLGSPERIDYLHDFFDDVAEGRISLTEHGGIGGLDEYLTEVSLSGEITRNGLSDVFPTFIAEAVRDPAFFESLPTEEIRYRDEPVDRSARGNVRAVAASAHDVRVRVPPGKVAGLEIRLREDHDDLHLIVDDERYDRMDEDEDRNVFRTALSGRAEPHEFLVRVANVAESAVETERRDYTLEFTLDPMEPCSEATMMAALHPEQRERVKWSGVRFGMAALMTRRSMIAPADEYMEEFEATPGLHPAPGRIEIGGLVSDGGFACTDPIGTNPDLEAWVGDPETAERAAEAMASRLVERLKNLSPEEERRIREARPDSGSLSVAFLPIMRRDRGGFVAMLRLLDRVSDALILLYSPNAFTWQTGFPWVPDPGGRLLKHDGSTGWSANAGAAMLLRLPDVRPAEMREDSTYRAVLVGPGGEKPIYSRWEGVEREAMCDDQSGQVQFQGTAEQIVPGSLEGTVTVTDITGAEVHGTFRLRGTGTLLRQDFSFIYNKYGRLCDTDWKYDDGPRAVRSGAVRISGRFSAPAVAEVERFGRIIPFTKVVEKR